MKLYEDTRAPNPRRVRTFLAIDRFTVADVTAFVALDFGRIVALKPSESHPSIRRWAEEIRARPSASA